MANIKKGDLVQVISGRCQARGGDRGKQGKVLEVITEKNRVIVEGINFVTKHQKAQPTPADPNPTGGKVVVEVPILASKVALVNANGEATRVRSQVIDGKKVRVAVKGGQVI
jgi:large subunit ribosomal protein L24